MGNTLDDLGLLLQTKGVGTLGQTIFKGSLPMTTPAVPVPDSVVALIELAGPASLRNHDGPDAGIFQPVIQVLARGQAHDYLDASTRADAAYLALDGVSNTPVNGTVYLWIFALQSAPFVLRQADEMGRPILAFSVLCGKAR